MPVKLGGERQHMGMNRACPIIPTPVVPPLYQPSNSVSSDYSSRSSPNKATTPYTHHKSLSLPIYISENEKVSHKVNHDDDQDVACEQDRRHLHRSNYDLYREDQNIPGTVTDNCNHSTQIFVKVSTVFL